MARLPTDPQPFDVQSSAIATPSTKSSPTASPRRNLFRQSPGASRQPLSLKPHLPRFATPWRLRDTDNNNNNNAIPRPPSVVTPSHSQPRTIDTTATTTVTAEATTPNESQSQRESPSSSPSPSGGVVVAYQEPTFLVRKRHRHRQRQRKRHYLYNEYEYQHPYPYQYPYPYCHSHRGSTSSFSVETIATQLGRSPIVVSFGATIEDDTTDLDTETIPAPTSLSSRGRVQTGPFQHRRPSTEGNNSNNNSYDSDDDVVDRHPLDEILNPASADTSVFNVTEMLSLMNCSAMNCSLMPCGEMKPNECHDIA